MNPGDHWSKLLILNIVETIGKHCRTKESLLVDTVLELT